jgi:hypothetical protein
VDLFLHEVVRHHGLPRKVIHDRGPQFRAEFWKLVMQRMGHPAWFHSCPSFSVQRASGA